MMKINEIGKFILIDKHSNEYDLKETTNLICIKGNEIFIGTKAIDMYYCADAIFTINFTNENVVLIKSSGKIYVNCNEIESTGYNLNDNVTISTEKTSITFKFICDKANLEKLIDMFMDGNLDYTLDMDYFFYEYAKKMKITDTKAISNVMASIDIPEIDKL